LELRAAGLESLAAGNAERAIEFLAAAAAMRPRLPEANFNLAQALRRAEKFDAARLAFQAVVTWAPSSLEAKEARQRLEELPSPPPAREDFTKDQVISSTVTGNRWTVLDVKKGGYGVVYKVRDREDGRIRALKTFQARYLWSEADRQRFEREAMTWIRLDPHPNIVTAEWIELVQEFPCVVQEFVEGGDLFQLLRTQPLPVPRAIELGIQFCDGMGFAHTTMGIVHRDIKSENCLLTTSGNLKIGDFGLARCFSDSGISALSCIGVSPSDRMSYTSPLGTWSYMAPEQSNPEAKLDARTDIHAFGVLLYEMLTRDLPAYAPTGGSDRGLEHGWVAHEYLLSAREEYKLPASLWELVLACVEHDPADRPASFADVRDALAGINSRRYRCVTPDPPEPLPVDVVSLQNKAVGFHTLQHYLEATECYDRALTMDPLDPELLQNRGAAFVCLKRWDEALLSLGAADAIAPQDGDIWNNMGLAYRGKQQADQAIRCFKKAAEFSPEDSLVYKNLAETLCEAGRACEAREYISYGLIVDAQNVALLELDGFALFSLKRFPEALARFDEAIPLSPRRFGLWKGKTLVDFALGNYRSSLDNVNRALEIGPKEVELLITKAKVLVALQDPRAALSTLQVVLALHHTDDNLKAEVTRLLELVGGETRELPVEEEDRCV